MQSSTTLRPPIGWTNPILRAWFPASVKTIALNYLSAAALLLSSHIGETFAGSDHLNYDLGQVPNQDDFDAWAFDRDGREDEADSANYVSREMTGYEVNDLQGTLTKAKASGGIVLIEPFTSDGRAAAMVQFPGGYIAEVHAVAPK